MFYFEFRCLQCEVQYIDYGNKEVVKNVDLRVIPSKQVTKPYAIRCSLFGLRSVYDSGTIGFLRVSKICFVCFISLYNLKIYESSFNFLLYNMVYLLLCTGQFEPLFIFK